ncbi:MAG: TRAP transporter substrate-binding protein [Deltaproteobacteria bacterium]|nr:TRAP transporter substrate-binding protein [Deltaproteobacteria bacterium]
MDKKSTWIFLVSLLVALSLAWSTPADAVRKLKYGHNTKQDQPTGKAALKFAELAKQKTNGEIIVEVFPANQLGNNRQMAENVKMDAQDLTTMGLAALGYLNDNFMMMQVPYVFRSQEHIQKVVRGPLGQRIKADLAKKDQIILLAMDWDRMVRHIGGRKPIRVLADLKGYKVRAGVLPPIAGFKALGASPVKIPLNEMYVALQQGVADGAELPVDYFYEYSIYEVAKYLNLTYHTYGTQFLGINKRVWESLKPEHQKALQQAADEAGAYNNKLVAELQDDYMAKLKKAGMKMIQTNVEELRHALRSRIPEIAKNWPGTLEIYEKIQATP